MSELNNMSATVEIPLNLLFAIILVLLIIILFKIIKTLNNVNRVVKRNEKDAQEIVQINKENSALIHQLLTKANEPSEDVISAIHSFASIANDVAKVTASAAYITDKVDKGVDDVENLLGNAAKISSLVKAATERYENQKDGNDE